MFLENVFVHEDFLSTVKKTSYRKYTGFWGHSQNPTPHRILEI